MKAILALASLLCGFVAFGAGAVERPPRLPAHAWLLVDYATGSVLVEHDADRKLPPASLTKLMTAYLVFEQLHAGKIRLQDVVTVSPHAASIRGSRMRLRAGTELSVEDLIKNMLVRSANDAAVALAEYVGGSEAQFVDAMNARARAWELRGTHFMNATGLDSIGHFSTARDLSRIAAALIRDFPEYYPWFSLREFAFNAIPVRNSNGLLWRDDAVDGMKTGYTRHAGWCLIASAVQGQMRLIATVLGAASDGGRVNSSERLLDYGFRNFETRLLYAANSPATQARVWLGDSATVPLGLAENLYLTLPRGAYSRLESSVTTSDMLYAPVHYGQRLGMLTLKLDNKVFGQYPLVALKDVPAGGVVEQTIDNLQLWLR